MGELIKFPRPNEVPESKRKEFISLWRGYEMAVVDGDKDVAVELSGKIRELLSSK